MIYVGIDIAKLNHFASALSSDGEILLQPFSFSNSYDGFCKLQTKLEPFGTDNHVIALESTAHYGNNLVEYLVLHGYKVCILNPLQTSSFRRNNIRKTKTDKLDTFFIAKTLMANPTRFVTKRDIDILFRFPNPAKLLAFAGLDPAVYQSGNFQVRRTRMSKRGSRVSRYALINAAHNVVKNNQTFKTYYDKKMADGRQHYNALGHCAGKLVRILYKMLTENIAFQLS